MIVDTSCPRSAENEEAEDRCGGGSGGSVLENGQEHAQHATEAVYQAREEGGEVKARWDWQEVDRFILAALSSPAACEPSPLLIALMRPRHRLLLLTRFQKIPERLVRWGMGCL